MKNLLFNLLLFTGTVFSFYFRSSAQTHPYLFFNQTEIPSIRTRALTTGTPANQIWNLIYQQQASYYSNPSFPERAAEIAGNRDVYENVYSLALTYVINQDNRFLSEVRRVLWQGHGSTAGLLFQPADNRAPHFGSTRVKALSLVYDLLYNDLRPGERDTIKQVLISDIYTNGLRNKVNDVYQHRYGSNQWAIWASAIGTAAITLYGDPSYPDANADLQLVRARLVSDSDSYLSRVFYDGAGFEGIQYGLLGLSRLFPFMKILSRWDDIDYFHLTNIQNRLKLIPEWLAYEVLPAPRTINRFFNNINDSDLGQEYVIDNGNGMLANLLILAGLFQDGLAQWVFNNTVQDIPNLLRKTFYYYQRNSLTPLLFMTFLVYDGVTSIEPAAILKKSKQFKERGLVYIRTSDTWADPNDIQFGMEAHQMVNSTTGIYTWIHNQSDKNHFTLYAYGQDFIIDQGYTIPSYPEDHNYILIDGVGQARNPCTPLNCSFYGLVSAENLTVAFSSSVDFIHGDAKRAFNYIYSHGWTCSSDPNVAYCLRDASDPNYAPYINTVQKADRFVNFVKSTNGIPGYIIITDDIQKDQNVHEYKWRIYTKGTVGSSGNPYIINGNRNSSNKLYLYYYDGSPVSISSSSQVVQVQSGSDPIGPVAPDDPQLIPKIDFTKPGVTNPYFHFLLLPYKPGLALPTSVTPICVTNGSVLKSTWSGYEDYSIFRQSGSITSSFVTTDGKLSVVRVNTSTSLPIMYSMGKGSQLAFNGLELINLFGSNASVAYSNNTVEIDGTVNYFRAYAPNASTVKINGSAVGFVQVGNYVESNNVNINRTWSGNIFTNYTVTVSAILRIDMGSIFKFGSYTKLFVTGKLDANGTSSQPITFTSASVTPSPGSWSSIELRGGPNTLKYCNVQYATNGIIVNSTNGTTIENCNFRNCSNYGIYGLNAYGYGAIQIKGCTLENNRRGLHLNNAWASVVASSTDVTRIHSNTEMGIYALNAYMYIHHTTIENNSDYGVWIDGYGSNVYFTTTGGSGRGYNTIRNNNSGQVKTVNANTFLGLKMLYCDCGGITKSTSSNNTLSLDKCAPPCYWRWYESGGYNSISGPELWVWNTAVLVRANLNYWDYPPICDLPSTKFAGNVDRAFPLCYSGIEQANIVESNGENIEGNLFSITSSIDSLKVVSLIKYLKKEITLMPDSADYLLTMLLPLVGPGGKFTEILGMPWEAYLTQIIQSTPSKTLRTRAMLYRIQSRMFAQDYQSVIDLTNWILAKQPNDTMWFYCQSQKISGYVSMGDRPSAEQIYQDMVIRGKQIDPRGMIELRSMIDFGSGAFMTARQQSDIDQSFTKTKIVPNAYILEQNYPNPFNSITEIHYGLPFDAHVTLKVYNILGREIITLADEMQTAGYKSVNFDASNLPSGVYFYQIQMGKFSNINKMILIR
ncbi:MAG: T9SS type A sorting domain-containing protein [Bacteroidota bacterium]|nr:T9SS type A sorting domain-containing protein [Bacteroidota bacterium]